MKSYLCAGTKAMKLAVFCMLFVVVAEKAAFADGSEYSQASPGGLAASLAAAKDQLGLDKKSAAVDCKGSLCTLFSTSVSKQSFTVSTYVGTGTMPSTTGSATNYYVGTGTTSSTTNQLGYGILVSWDTTHCTKNINVDKSVYDAVTTYMKNLLSSKPGEEQTFPEFTPAEQTMILFYTTVMDLTKGSTCN